MTEKQQQHIDDIVAKAGDLIRVKYQIGAEKHNNNLFDLSAEDLIDEAILEAIDQIIYLLTLKEKCNTNKDT